MITYALSAPWSFADLVTESAAAALRKSKFRCFEVSFSKYVFDDEAVLASIRLVRQLIAEGTIRPVSVHLPFSASWDASAPDEELRKDVSARLVGMIRDHADEMAPMVTLHALRQNERACWFLENCHRLVPEIETFRIPGN